MKIAIIGSAYPLRGGLAAFNERLAEELMDQGHDVTIWSFSLQYPGFLFPGKTQFSDGPPPARLKIVTALNSVNPLSWLSVGARIKKEQYDLIFIKYWLPFMGPAFGTVLRQAKAKGTKVVCIVDNIIPHEKRPGDKQFTNYFIGPVDAFVTMSRDVLKDVKTFTSKPAFFSPHPVYDIFGPGLDRAKACELLVLTPANKYMLFFGFIRDYKGLDLLLQAMTDSRVRQMNIHLIVAGEYYDKNVEAANNAIIANGNLKEQVHLFTDYIPNEEVSRFFSAANVVVQPYKHATQSGITQIAYHFEKPMIVTNVGGLPEVVPDGKVGFTAEPEPKAIADAIIRFFTPGCLPGLEASIKQEKQKYTWETFTQVLMKAAGK